ncbi:RAMP superfamily CRISPR-associated protein [Egbenema bharatensis]|uniref:RAMP superfamily CRISPR-associated protein n=1 Tax=Egbenema bharatensis TaxID=3463334 RepID=UPI003A88284D
MNNPPRNKAPKTETLLVELLQQQHQDRSPHLFKRGTFTLAWRAKVGSFPFPNLETIVSAAEPCGRFDWRSQNNVDRFQYHLPPPINEKSEAVPEYFGDLNDLVKKHRTLKLNGYIPGSAIRGIVRAWAMQRPELRREAIRLLGQQVNDQIMPGKIVFLDAWPDQTHPLTIDVVNPQEKFQVYHDNSEQPAPHALYALGDGLTPVPFTVAIRGIPGKASPEAVNTVWGWIEQALAEHGLGGRTASGYGMLESAQDTTSAPDPTHPVQRFDFTLYSQGVEGAIPRQIELRPSHWRGWLRSWTLRFLLGVMAERNAKVILEGLFGTLESTEDGKHRQGCVRIQLLPRKPGAPWGESSKLEESKSSGGSSSKQPNPDFYIWKGQIQMSAPADILESVLLPIVQIAMSVGGVGRGWRRPLHFFMGKDRNGNSKKYSRGTHLVFSKVGDSHLDELRLNQDQWKALYDRWVEAVRAKWGDRGEPDNLAAEVFSPKTCAVFAVPGPTEEPIDFDGTRSSRGNQQMSRSMAFARGARPGQQQSNPSSSGEAQRSSVIQWTVTSSEKTRGKGLDLVYKTSESKPPRNYKRNPDVGGKAAAGGSKSSFCSWVSIRRVDVPHPTVETETQEVVCLFLGGQTAQGYHPDRYQFLRDLGGIEGSQHLFGVPAPAQT